MSKKWLKGLKSLSKKKETAQVPREIAEIKAEYDDLTKKAGAAQYQVLIHQENLNQINRRLFSLNNEADARSKIDAQSKQVENKIAQDKATAPQPQGAQ